uniref:Uncharacterized protein n=1 Tax=Rhizophora mucronata TaxID=61149 RepID=A0A2P2JIU8_RHIMU
MQLVTEHVRHSVCTNGGKGQSHKILHKQQSTECNAWQNQPKVTCILVKVRRPAVVSRYQIRQSP